jgi:hypothetical protein
MAAAVAATPPSLRQHLALLAPSPPAPAPAADPRAGIRQILDGLDCARVQARIDGDVVHLGGHTRSAADRLRLERAISGVAGVRRVDAGDLRVLGDPYCRILGFLARPGLTRSSDQHDDLAAIGDPAEAGVKRFKGGMPLALGFSAPEYDSFVYVDYFSADGSVAHLLPAGAPGDNHLAPNQKLLIGQGGRGLQAVIGPPYGLDVVVALASSAPLPFGSRPVSEDGAAYLAALETATASLRHRHPATRIEYAYFLIYTGATQVPEAAAGTDGAQTAARP